jgi:hypothetical protein
MKRFSIGAAVLLVLALSAPALARVELSGFGGYQFGGRIPTNQGEIDFKDQWMYGASIEFALPMKPGTGFILWYNRVDTEARLQNAFGRQHLTDVSLNYFQGGGVYNIDKGTPLVPFTMLTLGATWVDPTDPLYQGFTKFSFAFGGGVKYWASEKVALRLQFNLFMTFLNSGLFVGVGSGGGNISVGGSGFAQGAVSGGLVIGLGD